MKNNSFQLPHQSSDNFQLKLPDKGSICLYLFTYVRSHISNNNNSMKTLIILVISLIGVSDRCISHGSFPQ